MSNNTPLDDKVNHYHANQTRTLLFIIATAATLCMAVFLVFIAGRITCTYFTWLLQNATTQAHVSTLKIFWHYPLMFLVSAVTLLILLVKSTATFNKNKYEQADIDAPSLYSLVEKILDVIKPKDK